MPLISRIHQTCADTVCTSTAAHSIPSYTKTAPHTCVNKYLFSLFNTIESYYDTTLHGTTLHGTTLHGTTLHGTTLVRDLHLTPATQ